MEYVVLALVFVLAVVYMALWVRIRRNQNGFCDGMVEVTVGQLVAQSVQRKGKTGTFGDETHKKTQVTYRYQVNDVTYDCHCTIIDHFRPMPASTRVAYQRKNPQMSYLPEFEAPDVKGMSSFYLSGSVLFFVIGVLYILFGM